MMLLLQRMALALVLALSVSYTTRDSRAETNDDILHTPKRLLTEERKQMDAGRRLSKVVRRIDWLLEDLKSNGLETEGGVERYATAKKQLASVGSSNLPKAIESLRSARADLAGAYPHLENADREIEVIVTKLDLALGEASNELLTDVALRELRQIIKQQEFLTRQTGTLIENKSQNEEYVRLGKAQGALASPTNRLVVLLGDSQLEIDELTRERFAAAFEVIKSAPSLMLDAGIRMGVNELHRPLTTQGEILVRLHKAERILSGEEFHLDESLKSLRQLLEELEHAKKEAEADIEKEFVFNTWHGYLFRVTEIKTGVAAWASIKAVEGGPMAAPLREADTALRKAQGVFHYIHHPGKGPRKEMVNHMAEAIDALKRALAEGEKQQPKNDADFNTDLEGEGDAEGEGSREGDGEIEAVGTDDTDGEEPGAPPGEEQTDGGKMQRDRDGLGDAEQPPKDGEEVESASGSEGKPGDPGPSKFEGKGGPIGGGKVEETDDSGTSINAKSDAKRIKLTRKTPTGSLGITFKLDGERPGGAQARDAVSHRRRSAAIKKYVEQLPPEFRQQVADYYEALAK